LKWQAQAGDEVVAIGEDLGPSANQAPAIAEVAHGRKLLDETVALDGDQPRVNSTRANCAKTRSS
jgi:hypothetical protein